MFRAKLVTASVGLFLAISLSGCASVAHLNDPARSANALDVATLLGPREIPYESQERNGLRISYSLMFARLGQAGYRLTLVFRNVGNDEKQVAPIVALQDASGLLISPSSYDGMMAIGAALAGTPIPSSQGSSEPTRYYNSGTMRDWASGRTGDYSGYTSTAPSGGFAGGFARGVARAEAMGAASDREEGRLVMQWTSAFWLRSDYRLPPGSAASGALFFPSPKLGPLPLKLTVDAGGSRFEFLTTSKTQR